MTTQTKPIEAYSLPTPNGQKLHIMLEELGVPYTYHRINIGAGDQFKPEFLAISPNNKIPAIVDPEGPGGTPISVFESGAILKYLGLKFGQLYPTDMRAQV
ncbi:MAG TPA: glutathione S-transferase N-terminal domain-containing protein, partial [Devosia sp.]|nr:glutathione S-transferase N-terminal domain-containing protein [Devosia sp.]